MKTTTIAAFVLATTTTFATGAMANGTCNNTIETIDGVVTYTASVCTGQAPASEVVLGLMTEARNAPDGPDTPTDEELVAGLNSTIDSLTVQIKGMSRGAAKRALKAQRRELRERRNAILAS